MLNQIVLVGRLTNIKKDNEENNTIVSVVVPQTFKNENGEYDNNYIDIVMSGNVASNVINYCKNGDLIGIKGKVQRLDNTKEIEIIADRVTFLTSGKENN